MQADVCGCGCGVTHVYVSFRPPITHASQTFGTPCITPTAVLSSGARGAGHRSMPVIRGGNYTHNLFNGPQVQQRREAHKDPDQGGLLLHRREQEVQEHNSESFQPLSRTLKKEIPPLEFINKSSRSLNEVSKPEFYFSCVHKNSHD